MRAVWSFWSAPYRAHYHARWASERRHLLAWALSFALASRHYPDTALVTDSAGARLLIDGLGLEFGHVDLSLDALDAAGVDTDWWVLGKLTAYAAQTAPFLHLDNDVFLWRPLAESVTRAALFAQNPERFRFEDQSLYRLDPFLAAIARVDGWLPPAWWRYAARRRDRALCCGVIGGQDVDFLTAYARDAIAIIRHPRNAAAWPLLGVRDNILAEQYFLAACAEHRWGPAAEARMAFVFGSSDEAFDPPCAARAGFTHLIGEAKANAEIGARLEQRVARDHPDLYARCVALTP